MPLIIKKYIFVFFVVTNISCDAITNTAFNTNIRNYSETDNINLTSVKTLQKEELGRNANFAPAGKPIKFKEIPDSDLSSSSNSRGLLYHGQSGYGLIDYEDSPHYGYDYPLHDIGHHDVHGPHGYDHHDSTHHHYPAHHHEHGHYKHYNHALAAKTILWPIAGIALLGAAAALVSNPVLLQLGVVSGRRKRRETEEVSEPDFLTNTLKKFEDKINTVNDTIQNKSTKVAQDSDENFQKRMLQRVFLKDVRHVPNKITPRPFVKTTINRNSIAMLNENNRYVPIVLKLNNPNVSV